MILEPPCAPVIINGFPSLRTIVGVIELRGLFKGSILFASFPKSKK